MDILLSYSRFIIDILPSLIDEISISQTSINIFVSNETNKAILIHILRQSSIIYFNYLIDFFIIPQINGLYNFVGRLLVRNITYNLSLTINYRLGLETQSLELIFPAMSWLEREAWDLYGVVFNGSSDLRRILTDYGFNGFPLRKDYPVIGFYELRYSDTNKRILVYALSMAQDHRAFAPRIINPWVDS